MTKMTKIKDETKKLPGGLIVREIMLRCPDGTESDKWLIGIGPCCGDLSIVCDIPMQAYGPIADACPLAELADQKVSPSWGLHANNYRHWSDLGEGLSWKIHTESESGVEAFIESWKKRVEWVHKRRMETKSMAV
jgi:hypothetical protein